MLILLLFFVRALVHVSLFTDAVSFFFSLKGVCAYVERCPEAARILQDLNGRVSLDPVVYSKKELCSTIFSVNLDSVYSSHKGIKVYELSRVKGEERNIFRLIVELHFVDGTTREFTSKSFQVQSKKTPKHGQG